MASSVANSLKMIAKMLTHIHMVVLAHLQSRKKLELKQINSVKKLRQNRSLEVTGCWPRED